MKHLYIYRIYETGRAGSRDIGVCPLACQLRKALDTAHVTAHVTAHEEDGNNYVLLSYHTDKHMEVEQFREHYEKVTAAVGTLADQLGSELAIEFFLNTGGGVVTPDSLAGKKSTGDEGTGGDGDEDYDEWAEVKRLRSINTKH